MTKNIIAITAITRDEWIKMYELANKIADRYTACNILNYTYYALLQDKIEKAIGTHTFHGDYITDENDNVYVLDTDFNCNHTKLYIYCYQI